MKTRHLLPDPTVAAYVDRVLVIEKSELTTSFILPLYPNGVPTILYKSAPGKIGQQKCSHLTLFGQTVSPESLFLEEDFVLIAYFFKPFSLISLFGLQAIEITDNPIDLTLLFTDRTRILEDRLLDSEDVNTMLQLLNDFIFELVSKERVTNESIRYASLQIAKHPSKEVLFEVQKELHLTERTFQRMFEKNIGIAPNLYRRICQFNTAFNLLNERRGGKLTDIAFENGYADQSHFIRSFKEFTGITPGDYLRFGS